MKYFLVAFILTASFLTAAVITTTHARQLTLAPGQVHIVKSGIAKFKTPTRRIKKKCNGKTTAQCCSGLSYCGCLYMPGSSSDNHPTSCHSNPPPRNRN